MFIGQIWCLLACRKLYFVKCFIFVITLGRAITHLIMVLLLILCLFHTLHSSLCCLYLQHCISVLL